MDKSPGSVDISAIMKDGVLITEAIRRGGIEAMKRHIQAGVPMVSWRDGKVYYIFPDELKEMLAEPESML